MLMLTAVAVVLIDRQFVEGDCGWIHLFFSPEIFSICNGSQREIDGFWHVQSVSQDLFYRAYNISRAPYFP